MYIHVCPSEVADIQWRIQPFTVQLAYTANAPLLFNAAREDTDSFLETFTKTNRPIMALNASKSTDMESYNTCSAECLTAFTLFEKSVFVFAFRVTECGDISSFFTLS